MDSAKTIVCDCDGVLTNGKVYYDAKGGRTKGFHSRDIRAIRQLISHGFRFVILTQSSWPGIDDFAKRTGAEVIMDREKKTDGLEPFIAIGDDTSDIEMLSKAVLAYCPVDADAEVIAMCRVKILMAKGGEAVIAELLRELEIIRNLEKALGK